MRCVFLGESVGVVAKQCCGGELQTTPVLACHCPQSAVPFTSGETVLEGFVPLRLSSGESMRKVPSCARCQFREEPIDLPRLPVTPTNTPTSLAKAIWQERRDKRRWAGPERRSVVVNCDTHGYGDACVAAWLAEGTKRDNPRVLLHATGPKREFLELLGQAVVPATGDYLGQCFEADKLLQGHPPRVHAWLSTFGIAGTFARPEHTLTGEQIAWGRNAVPDARTVLLYPQTAHLHREWPAAYWLELADRLRQTGRPVRLVCTHDERYRDAGDYLEVKNWRQSAAIMLAGAVVVGNDSAPVHVAGTLDVPALAILGPTTDGVFAHARSVRCIAAERRVMECVGCWFGWGFTPACDFGCAALSNVSPEAVADRVLSIAKEERR